MADSCIAEAIIEPTEAEALTNTSDVSVDNEYEVEAYINNWVLTNDDIYIRKYEEEPPQWLTDYINHIIEDPDGQLVHTIRDLYNLIDSMDDGFSSEIYQLKQADKSHTAKIDTLVAKTDDNAAAIIDVKDTYATRTYARAVSSEVVGAYLNDASLGGAWFEQNISAVADVAYSAARSASTLNATMKSQYDEMQFIAGEVDVLQKQVDGVIETWFYDDQNGTNIGPNYADGSINKSAEPYATWVAENARSIHTGDSYVLYEIDTSGNKLYLGSWQFARGAINEPETDAQGYFWVKISDNRAEEAYQLALDAKTTADGKIVTFYQALPPTDAESSYGDLWIDSDDNKLYRYDGSAWVEVQDEDIKASVQMLSEAMVDVDGVARAYASLNVDADGNISGIRLNSTNDPDDPGSSVQIYADKFYISDGNNTSWSAAPFSIDTTVTPTAIKFNGRVLFENIDGGENIITRGTIVEEINKEPGTTLISGGKINTDEIVLGHLDYNGSTVIDKDGMSVYYAGVERVRIGRL